MDRASRAGVEGVHRAQRVDGLLDIAHRHADQSLLERTVLALLVLRSQVPRGRDDDLVTLDLAVLNGLAVVKGATRGLPETGAFASGGLRSAEVLGVAGLHGLDQLIDPLLHASGDVKRLDLADSGTAERGLNHGQVALMAKGLEERIHVLLDERHVAFVSCQNTGKAGGLHGVAVVGRALHPGVAIVHIVVGVLRLSGEVRRLIGLGTLVPGTADPLGDGLLVGLGKVEVLVKHAGGQIAVGHLEVLALEDAPSDVATRALAVLERIGVVRGDSQHIGDHGRLDPVVQLVNQQLQVVELLVGGHEGRAARTQGHDMRHLAAQQGADLRSLGLHAQSLQVVGRADEVELGRQLEAGAVLGVEPVAAEDGQLAVLGELGQMLLQGHEVAVHGSAGSTSQVHGVGRVGLQRVQRVDVVKAGQVVEPQDVAVQELGALEDVADDAGVVGDGDAVSLLSRDGAGMGVRHGANAADALHDLGSVLGRAVLNDQLDAAEAATGYPGVGYLAVLDFHLNAQMALDTGYGIDYGTRHGLPPFLGCIGVVVTGVFLVHLLALGLGHLVGAHGLLGVLGIPGALLLEVRAAVHTAGGLHAEAVHHERCGKDAGNAHGDGGGLHVPVADMQAAMTLQERGVHLDPVLARVVGVGLAAADARGAGLDAPAATVVPHDHAAVGLGLRTAAAERIQAVALLLLFGTEFVDELAVLEVAATLAVVMDGLIEDAGRLALGVEVQIGGLELHEHNVDEHAGEPLRVGRAAGDVDDGHVDAGLLKVLLHAHSVGDVGLCAHPTAVDGAGAQRDHGVGVLSSLDQVLGAGLAGNAQGVAAPLLLNRAFIDEDVVAGLDGLLLGLLHGVARCCGQRLGVVQGDHVQHHLCGVGRLSLGERLGAAGAGCAFDPDDRVKVTLRGADDGRLESLGYLRDRQLGQPGGSGHGTAQLHEVATGDPPGLKHVRERGHCGLSFHTHTSLQVYLVWPVSRPFCIWSEDTQRARGRCSAYAGDRACGLDGAARNATEGAGLAEPEPSVVKRARAPSPIGDEIADFHPQSSPLLFVMLSLAHFYTEPLSYLRKINE